MPCFIIFTLNEGVLEAQRITFVIYVSPYLTIQLQLTLCCRKFQNVVRHNALIIERERRFRSHLHIYMKMSVIYQEHVLKAN